MVVAAGSEAERRQLGQLSLKHRKALVDVGADYLRGHVQVCGSLLFDPERNVIILCCVKKNYQESNPLVVSFQNLINFVPSSS